MTDDNESARIFAHAIPRKRSSIESQGRYVPMFPYPPGRPVVFVKYGCPQKQAEGEMQRFAFDWVSAEWRKSHCIIYVPEVYKIFGRNPPEFHNYAAC